MSVIEGHRAYIISGTDRAGLIVIAAGVWMAWMVLSLTTRLYTRIVITGPLSIDDLMASIGSLFGVIQFAIIMNAIDHGFGMSSSLLSPAQIYNAEKYAYISDILFIIAHSCAKISVTLLLLRLGYDIRFRNYCLAIIGFVICWTIASVVAVAIKCDTAQPWLVNASCKNVIARWTGYTIIDSLTELLLVATSVYLVWGLQMRYSAKTVVIGAFGSRLLVIITTILRMIYIKDALQSDDYTLNTVNAAVATQVLMNFSLIAASVPTLKPFMVSFNTGWGQGVNKTAPTGYGHSRSSRSPPRPERLSMSNKIYGNMSSNQSTEIGVLSSEITETRRPHGRNLSTASKQSIESGKMIIHETRSWTVEHESIQTAPLSAPLSAPAEYDTSGIGPNVFLSWPCYAAYSESQ